MINSIVKNPLGRTCAIIQGKEQLTENVNFACVPYLKQCANFKWGDIVKYLFGLFIIHEEE